MPDNTDAWSFPQEDPGVIHNLDGSKWVPMTNSAAPVKEYGAEATGGLDDLDAYYGGKSAGNAAEKGGIRKTYHGGVRPDHMMFESIAVEKALAMEPKICCPNCGQAVKGLDNAREAYPLPDSLKGREAISRMTYQLVACCCRVSPEWAGAYQREINIRTTYGVSQAGPVVDLTATERKLLQERLEKKLVELYTQRDKATDAKDRDYADYLLLATTDELMRLVPGIHNCLPPVHVESKELKKWAADKYIKTPPPKPYKDKFEFPNAYDHPTTAKMIGADKDAMTAQNILQGMRDGVVGMDAAQQLYDAITKPVVAPKIKLDPMKGWPPADAMDFKAELEDDFGYGDNYLFPSDLKKAKKPISSMSFLPFEDGKVGVFVQDGKHLMFNSREILKSWLVANDYDVSDFDTCIPIKAGSLSLGSQGKKLDSRTMPVGPAPKQPVYDWYDKLFKAAKQDMPSVEMVGMSDWWSKAFFEAGQERHVTKQQEAYSIAQKLLKESAYDRRDLLEYLDKQKGDISKLVRSCLLQLQSGAVMDGKPPTQAAKKQEADAIILTDDRIMNVVGQILRSLREHKALCESVASTCNPTLSRFAVVDKLGKYKKDIEEFASRRAFLDKETTAFIMAYLTKVHAASGVAAKSGLPVPADVVNMLAKCVEEAATAQEKAQAAATAAEFHKQFVRPKRKVRVLKKKPS